MSLLHKHSILISHPVLQVPLRPNAYYELTHGCKLTLADIKCVYYIDCLPDEDEEEDGEGEREGADAQDDSNAEATQAYNVDDNQEDEGEGEEETAAKDRSGTFIAHCQAKKI